jgi:hypothetical protein
VTGRGAAPSPTQRAALEKMGGWQGRFYRWPGGFWTVEPRPEKVRREGDWGVPHWHVGTPTVDALEKRGWVMRTHDFPEAWKDTRALTAAGLALLEGADAFTVGQEVG